MCPEWQTVNRLLAVYFGDREAFNQLTSALQRLDEALPNVEITGLTIDRLQHPIPSRFKAVVLADWQAEAEVTATLNRASGIQQPIVNFVSQRLTRAIESHHFDAAIIFTEPYQSTYLAGYLCYLAGIPIRVGQSREFGGGVLSHCIQPPVEEVLLAVYHLHLLEAVGIVDRLATQSVSQSPQTQLQSTANTAY